MSTTKRRWPLFLLLTLLGLVVVAMIPWFGSVRTAGYYSAKQGKAPYHFPKGFLWGTATAAQQVEHQQNSDWTAFERSVFKNKLFGYISPGVAKPGHIHNLNKVSDTVRKKKTDYDQRFRSDLAMAAKMGHNAYRFSISWSRLFPKEGMKEPDPKGVAFYKDVLATLRKLKMKPSATLFHFSSPAWLWKVKDGKKGWERKDALVHFERFVKAVAKVFVGEVDHWCTLNEPVVYIFQGYLEGIFPPNERRGAPIKIAPVMSQLLKAHALAYRILHEEAKKQKKKIVVGIAKHTRWFEPLRNIAPLDRITAKLVAQNFLYDFLDAIKTGTFSLTGTSYKETIKGLKGTQEYVGINYYGKLYIRSNLFKPGAFKVMNSDPADKKALVNNLGWTLHPKGFYLTLTSMHKRYKKPIYILENGLADARHDDKLRQHFLVAHLKELWNAIKFGGVDIRGYFHWTLTDNFEWAEGFGARFGLIQIDYKTFARKPRKSASLYSDIIRKNAITAAQWKAFKPKSSAGLKQELLKK
jgi:beta-glucosidase